MRDVSIIGIGQVEVGEHWDKSLRELGYYALSAAMRDAKVSHIDSLYVGNMLSGELTGQEHVGAIIADFAGLRGVEAVGIEAAYKEQVPILTAAAMRRYVAEVGDAVRALPR